MVEHGTDPRKYIPLTFVFKGPSGCGKTTVARKIGNLYYQMGLLATNEVIEASAKDMIAGYIGQTAIKTRSLLKSALGKVLFIDEAYRLTGNKLTLDSSHDNFASEARDELVDAMTKPDFLGNMVIILAGYESHMDIMLKGNPGIASRFRTHIHLPALSSEGCTLLFKKRIGEANVLSVFQQHEADLRDMFESLRVAPGWGNGRDVEAIATEIVGRVFENATSDSEPLADGGLVMDVLRD
jgi:AAA+ superfamily predicted ATPase